MRWTPQSFPPSRSPKSRPRSGVAWIRTVVILGIAVWSCLSLALNSYASSSSKTQTVNGPLTTKDGRPTRIKRDNNYSIRLPTTNDHDDENVLTSMLSKVLDLNNVTSWSTFPAEQTPFTHHVLELIHYRSETVDMDDSSLCPTIVNFTVSRPFQVPTISYAITPGFNTHYDLPILYRIFESMGLPYNVTIGFDYVDTSYEIHDKRPCWGSAALYGRNSIPNMEDRQKMQEFVENRGKGPSIYRWEYFDDDQSPWETRKTIPIFRGSLWAEEIVHTGGFSHPNLTDIPRWKAVNLSLHHPDLLDARFSQIDPKVLTFYLTSPVDNETMDKYHLNNVQFTDKKEYFSKYQVCLVLKGIGPAYRLNNHFMSRQAVILQEIEMQEWYIKYLRPYVHYIPVKADLSDLLEKLIWVRDHPAEIKAVAERGRLFWETFLTFDRHEEHLYELIYRLSEYEHWRDVVGDEAMVVWNASIGLPVGSENGIFERVPIMH